MSVYIYCSNATTKFLLGKNHPNCRPMMCSQRKLISDLFFGSKKKIMKMMKVINLSNQSVFLTSVKNSTKSELFLFIYLTHEFVMKQC